MVISNKDTSISSILGQIQNNLPTKSLSDLNRKLMQKTADPFGTMVYKYNFTPTEAEMILGAQGIVQQTPGGYPAQTTEDITSLVGRLLTQGQRTQKEIYDLFESGDFADILRIFPASEEGGTSMIHPPTSMAEIQQQYLTSMELENIPDAFQGLKYRFLTEAEQNEQFGLSTEGEVGVGVGFGKLLSAEILAHELAHQQWALLPDELKEEFLDKFSGEVDPIERHAEIYAATVTGYMADELKKFYPNLLEIDYNKVDIGTPLAFKPEPEFDDYDKPISLERARENWYMRPVHERRALEDYYSELAIGGLTKLRDNTASMLDSIGLSDVDPNNIEEHMKYHKEFDTDALIRTFTDMQEDFYNQFAGIGSLSEFSKVKRDGIGFGMISNEPLIPEFKEYVENIIPTYKAIAETPGLAPMQRFLMGVASTPIMKEVLEFSGALSEATGQAFENVFGEGSLKFGLPSWEQWGEIFTGGSALLARTFTGLDVTDEQVREAFRTITGGEWKAEPGYQMAEVSARGVGEMVPLVVIDAALKNGILRTSWRAVKELGLKPATKAALEANIIKKLDFKTVVLMEKLAALGEQRTFAQGMLYRILTAEKNWLRKVAVNSLNKRKAQRLYAKEMDMVEDLADDIVKQLEVKLLPAPKDVKLLNASPEMKQILQLEQRYKGTASNIKTGEPIQFRAFKPVPKNLLTPETRVFIGDMPDVFLTSSYMTDSYVRTALHAAGIERTRPFTQASMEKNLIRKENEIATMIVNAKNPLVIDKYLPSEAVTKYNELLREANSKSREIRFEEGIVVEMDASEKLANARAEAYRDWHNWLVTKGHDLLAIKSPYGYVEFLALDKGVLQDAYVFRGATQEIARKLTAERPYITSTPSMDVVKTVDRARLAGFRSMIPINKHEYKFYSPHLPQRMFSVGELRTIQSNDYIIIDSLYTRESFRNQTRVAFLDTIIKDAAGRHILVGDDISIYTDSMLAGMERRGLIKRYDIFPEYIDSWNVPSQTLRKMTEVIGALFRDNPSLGKTITKAQLDRLGQITLKIILGKATKADYRSYEMMQALVTDQVGRYANELIIPNRTAISSYMDKLKKRYVPEDILKNAQTQRDVYAQKLKDLGYSYSLEWEDVQRDVMGYSGGVQRLDLENKRLQKYYFELRDTILDYARLSDNSKLITDTEINYMAQNLARRITLHKEDLLESLRFREHTFGPKWTDQTKKLASEIDAIVENLDSTLRSDKIAGIDALMQLQHRFEQTVIPHMFGLEMTNIGDRLVDILEAIKNGQVTPRFYRYGEDSFYSGLPFFGRPPEIARDIAEMMRRVGLTEMPMIEDVVAMNYPENMGGKLGQQLAKVPYLGAAIRSMNPMLGATTKAERYVIGWQQLQQIGNSLAALKMLPAYSKPNPIKLKVDKKISGRNHYVMTNVTPRDPSYPLDPVAIAERPNNYVMPQDVRDLLDWLETTLSEQISKERLYGVTVDYAELLPGQRYFPRYYKSLEGLDIEVWNGIKKKKVSANQAFQKGRLYQEVRDAILAGKNPKADLIEAAQLRIQAGNKAIADAQLRRVLKGKDIGGFIPEPSRPPKLGQEGSIYQIAGLEKHIFPLDVANTVNSMIEKEVSASKILNDMTKLNAAARSGQTALDIGYMLIQGMMVLAWNPYHWGQALAGGIMTTINPRFMAKLANENIEDLVLMAQLGAAPFNTSEFTEALAKSGLLGKIPVVGSIFQHFGAGFQAALDISRLRLFQAMKYDAKSLEELRGIVNLIDSMVGISDAKRLGVGGFQRQLEANGFYASRYYRAFGSIINRALFGDGPSRTKARLALTKLMLAIPTIMAAAAYALGQEDRLKPTEEEWLPKMFDPRDPEFLTVRVGDIHLGLGGIYISMFKLLGNIIKSAANDPDSFVSLDPHENPVLRWGYGHFSPSISTAIDLATGANYLGERLDDWEDYMREAINKTFPFWAAGQITDVPSGGWAKSVMEFWGFRAWAIQYYEEAREYANEHIKDMPDDMLMDWQREILKTRPLTYDDINQEQRNWLYLSFEDYRTAQEKAWAERTEKGTDFQVADTEIMEMLTAARDFDLETVAQGVIDGNNTLYDYRKESTRQDQIFSDIMIYRTAMEQHPLFDKERIEEQAKWKEENTTPEDIAYDDYRELRANPPKKDGVPQWDLWHENVEQFLSFLPDEIQEYIARRELQRISYLPPAAKAIESLLYEASQKTQMYYDLPEDLRADYRASNPEFDAYLYIVWSSYGFETTVKSLEAEIKVNELLKQSGLPERVILELEDKFSLIAHETVDPYYEVPQGDARVDYRLKYPEIDAYLYLLGNVSLVRSNEAKAIANALIKEYNLRDKDGNKLTVKMIDEESLPEEEISIDDLLDSILR